MSPFFKQIFSDPTIDEATRRIALDLSVKGYAVLDFPDADLEAKSEAIKASLRDKYDFEQWRTVGHQAGISLRVQDAWEFDANVRSIACNQIIIELLSKLYGRRAWPFQTLNFPVGTQQHYHTDSVHFSSAPERFMCGVWLAMEDIDDDNGPLHGGSRQRDPQRTRWSQVTHYYFEDCAYFTPMMSDPFYGSIDFRKLTNIATGQEMPQRYAGHAIPPRSVDACIDRNWDEFDPALYLAANPDVAAAGANPAEHYLAHGIKERRKLRPD